MIICFSYNNVYLADGITALRVLHHGRWVVVSIKTECNERLVGLCLLLFFLFFSLLFPFFPFFSFSLFFSSFVLWDFFFPVPTSSVCQRWEKTNPLCNPLPYIPFKHTYMFGLPITTIFLAFFPSVQFFSAAFFLRQALLHRQLFREKKYSFGV